MRDNVVCSVGKVGCSAGKVGRSTDSVEFCCVDFYRVSDNVVCSVGKVGCSAGNVELGYCLSAIPTASR